MTTKKPVLIVLVILLLAGLFATQNVIPVHAAKWTLNQDANNTSTANDVLIQTTGSFAKSFRIGAVLTNASSTNPLTVFGWQFTINYDATLFVPQGDPSAAATYPDGAANTVIFGSQTTAGTVNWAGKIAAQQAFATTTNSVSGSVGQFTVAYTILAPNTAVTVSAPNLFASVSFEIVSMPTAAQTFTISNVIFVDSTGGNIAGVAGGPPVTETITDSPPVARMVMTREPVGSANCVPACSAYAFQFDGSTSTAASGTIANPGGYFWDFGDGFQDLGVTGPVVIHDYQAAGAVVPANYNVTLRVQDIAGNTGAARDGLGNVILNTQPSHTQVLNLHVDIPPTASFTTTPSSGSSPLTVSFDGSASAPGQAGTTITTYFWNFGDGSAVQTTTTATTSHVYTVSTTTTFTASLIVQDNLGANSTSATHQIMVTSGVTIHPTTTTVSCTSPVVINQGSTCTVTVTDTSSSGATTPTGTVSLGETGVTGTFTTCTLLATTSAATCTSTFTATTSGTASVTANYPGDTSHTTSSGTTSITVGTRQTTTTVTCSPTSIGP